MHIDCLSNPDNQQVDVIISTVPWTDSAIPLMAPAALKPMVEQVGMTCLGVDFNVEIYNATLSQHESTASKQSQIFYNADVYDLVPHKSPGHLINFFFHGVGHPDINDWLYDMFESTARAMLSWKPKFIGLSLFSYVSRHSCEWLCYHIKKLSPDTKIIIGGAGCLEQFTGPSTFADNMLERGLVDYHIRGDGEHALKQLLLGNTSYPGINSVDWKEINNQELAKLPYPDYSDYDFTRYKKQMLGIQGSRGCVRACTFCDYITNWTKFQWRTGEVIFEEMKLQYSKYGIRVFQFQDTLTNGNLKEFNKLIQLLADYNESNPSESFHWGGYYIFREQSANDEEMWRTIAKSGAQILSVGIENLNEDIRYAIGKKFSNKSITFHIEQARLHNIRLDLLFIVGYITETQHHIDQAKIWLDNHVQYQDKILLSWGGTLGIFPNTWLDRNKARTGTIMIGNSPQQWVNPSIGSTVALRAQWVQDLIEHSEKLGYNVMSNQIDNHFVLEQLINTDV